MKKRFVILIFISISLTSLLFGCSQNLNDMDLCGTWKISHVNIDGSDFSISELEAMNDYSMSDSVLVIKDGGKAYLVEDGNGHLTDWESTKDGIQIGIRDFVISDGMLSADVGKGILYFEKVSDSQDYSEYTTSSPSPLPSSSPTTTLSPIPTSEPALTSESLYGTWTVTHLTTKDGTTYSVAELEKMGNYNVSGFYAIYKNDGVVTLCTKDQLLTGDWSIDGDIVMTGTNKMHFNDGKLYYESNGETSIWERISDSQDENDILIIVSSPTMSSETSPVSGIRPEFQEAMDSYEKFFDEYVEFMKKYSKSPDQTSMLSDYTKYLQQYSDTMTKLGEIGKGDMSSEELALYTDVMARINQKLLDVLQ